MKESIANSYIFTLCIIFVGILIVILVSSIGYTKTFKIKNRIVDILATDGKAATDGNSLSGATRQDIDDVLKAAGYRINGSYNRTGSKFNAQDNDQNGKCLRSVDRGSGMAQGEKAKYITKPGSPYEYCVYKISTSRGYYFKVTVFLSYEIPIMGVLEFPLTGESRLIYDL